MARRTFFSFHYKPDIWRAWNVRNSWVVSPSDQKSRGFFDSSVFEASRKESDEALKTFLRKGLENTSVTCVLAGTDTWSRSWVRYEIPRSLLKGNGLLTVHIHGVKNKDKQTSTKGANPLAHMGVCKADNGILFAERKGGKWVRYQDYARTIPESALWFAAPRNADVIPFSTYAKSYDFAAQSGRMNIGDWIEDAATQAGR